MRGAAWADCRLGSRLFFASLLREYFLLREPRHLDQVLPRAGPVGEVRVGRERGSGKWRAQTSAVDSHQAADSLLSGFARALPEAEVWSGQTIIR